MRAAVLVAASAAPRADTAHACACTASEHNPEGWFAGADAAFQGTAVRIEPRKHRSFTTFRVERVWKGPPRLTVEITGNGGTVVSSCDYPFNDGRSYVVFASYEDARLFGFYGELGTGDCAGNAPARERAGELGPSVPMEVVRAAFAAFGFGGSR
jgi:hypothetical protein